MHQTIVEKLQNGEKFGLYDDGNSCYFDDGTKVHYADLWEALRIIHDLHANHSKTLADLCPDSFRGTFEHKFRKHGDGKLHLF